MIIRNPVIISSVEMRCFFRTGSKIAVNNVRDERLTNATDTVDDLIDWKKNIQCKATIAPVKNSFKNVSFETLIDIFL